MSTREIEDVMTPRELADGINKMMQEVQAPWRTPLLMLLEAHPEAQVRFAQAHPYEAFEFIKATVSDVATFSPFEGKPPMNVHDFLGQRLAGMSLTYQVKDDSYRIA